MPNIDLKAFFGEDDKIPDVRKPREDLICVFIDPPENVVEMIPKKYYVLRIALGDEEIMSESIMILKRLRGRMWPEYYREYASKFDSLLKIHGILWTSNKLLMINPANPLAVLLMSSKAVDPRSSLSIITVREEEGISLPEAVNSHSVLKIAEKRRIPSIIVSEKFLEDLSGYTEEWGYVDSKEALAYIVRILSLAHKDISRSVSEDLDLGISSYGISTVIGASSTVFKSISTAMKAVFFRTSIDISPRKVLTLHIVVTAPKGLEREIEQSYREVVREYDGLLNHTLHIIDKDTRLGLYDIVALIGVERIPEFSALERQYRQLIERNPEARVENIVGDLQ